MKLYQLCVSFILLAYSHLISATDSGSLSIPVGLLRSALEPTFVAKFSLFVALLLAGTIAAGRAGKWLFRLPVIAGQIVGGIILGPSLLNVPGWAFFAEPLRLIQFDTWEIYSIASSDLFVFVIVLLSSALTVSYLLWIAGHETDIRDIYQIGFTAMAAGIFGALFPILMTVLVLMYGMPIGWSVAETVGIGLAFAATSVSIPVAMLFAYNKMHLQSSKATLGAAVIDDILAVVLLSLFFIGAEAGAFGQVTRLIVPGHGVSLLGSLVYMVGAFVFIGVTGYWGVPPLMRWLKKYHHSPMIAPLANIIMLLYFACAELFGGLAGITGAYFAGLFQRLGDKRHTAEKVFSPYVNAILLPLFLGSIGLQIDVTILDGFAWVIVVILLVVSIISKLLGCWVATAMSNWFGNRGTYRWRWIDTYLFGSSMVARGEVGLVVSTVLYGSKVISPYQYVIAVVVIVLTTIAAPIMLGVGFYWLRQLETYERPQEFTLNIGLFPIIGTMQMFNILVGRLKANGEYQTSVQMSEGRKIVNVEGLQVRLILCPDDGIILKGNHEHINHLLHIVKQAIEHDVERLGVI